MMFIVLAIMVLNLSNLKGKNTNVVWKNISTIYLCWYMDNKCRLHFGIIMLFGDTLLYFCGNLVRCQQHDIAQRYFQHSYNWKLILQQHFFFFFWLVRQSGSTKRVHLSIANQLLDCLEYHRLMIYSSLRDARVYSSSEYLYLHITFYICDSFA